MMRFHRLSPNILPLSNGKKPSLQATCKDDESDNIQSYSQFDATMTRSNRSPTQQVESNLASSSPSESPNKSHSHHSEISGFSNGGDLLQWGHNKKSRGSRAEHRSNSLGLAGGNEQSKRQVVKVQRRSAAIIAAQKVAAVSEAMPPPSMNCGSSRGSLRPSMVGRDCRTVEERSVGPHRADKGLSQSPARKSNKSPSNADCVVNPESKQPSDQETGRCSAGAVAATTAAIDKISFDRFELPRIFLTLSRKEKEDDFLAMKGTKLPHRPKKRAKNIDKSLQYCFPGMWLADLTRSRYEVREKKCVKKRRRGLKGMESMDSDSE